MPNHNRQGPWVKKAKWLTQALIVSGTLNVGLLTTFIYFSLSESSKPQQMKTNISEKVVVHRKEKIQLQQVLTKYSALSLDELLARLTLSEHIESGYTRRDLALGCLVTYHHFNLDRALGGVSLQRREITYTNTDTNEPSTLVVFPGLADYQYRAIATYAKTEKWPLTGEGLLREIKSAKPPYDSTLLEAFALTPEFHFITMLFSKTGIPIKKEHMCALLAEGGWDILNETAQYLRTEGTFSEEVRRKFLLEMASCNSLLAAKILLETDAEYCLKNLDNGQVLFLCDLLEDHASPAFLKALLESPRSDEIWKKAAAILYEQAAEDVPKKLDLNAAKFRFLELKESRPTPKRTARIVTYTVIPGDSLWKIARDSRVSIDEIRKANNLQTDRLQIGQTLNIPQK